MYGYNILGLNVHNKDYHSLDTDSQISLILEGAEENFNSFKKIKNYIDSTVVGGDGASLSQYLKSADAEATYQPKGNYLTEHQSLSGKQDVLTEAQLAVLNGNWLPAGTYLTEEQYKGTYSKPAGGIPASDLAAGVIPTSLPASDVAEWAKASTKPTYTAAEVGALPSTTVIPAAQVQSDWEATEGMGVILNKPEIYTNEQVDALYSVLEERITALESNNSTSSTTEYKAYFAIIPGTSTTYKTNLKNYTGEFLELTTKENLVNSDNEAGMIVVLYNKWIPEFSAYDENLLTWGTTIKLGSGSSTTGYSKTVSGTEYMLWYSTSAIVENNRLFKITLK